jgi:hypothetical protein
MTCVNFVIADRQRCSGSTATERLVTERGKKPGLARHKNLAADKVNTALVKHASSKITAAMQASRLAANRTLNFG